MAVIMRCSALSGPYSPSCFESCLFYVTIQKSLPLYDSQREKALVLRKKTETCSGKGEFQFVGVLGYGGNPIGVLGGTFFIVDHCPSCHRTFSKPVPLSKIAHCVPFRHYKNQNISAYLLISHRGPVLTMLGIKVLGRNQAMQIFDHVGLEPL